jgi:hypothetical protein
VDRLSSSAAITTSKSCSAKPRTQLESRGVASIDEAWIDDVTERIREGREVVVSEHDGSVDAGEAQDG